MLRNWWELSGSQRNKDVSELEALWARRHRLGRTPLPPRRVAVESESTQVAQQVTGGVMSYEERRDAAIERVKAKHGFRTHVVVYLAVNALLVLIWALSDAGYFWPIWPILGWGIGLALNAWKVHSKPISEEEIRGEMQRSGPPGTDN